jgi:glycine cleavage system H protein
VKEKNEELDTAAELVNSDPYGKGWMIRIELSNPSEIDELLDAEGYKKLL